MWRPCFALAFVLLALVACAATQASAQAGHPRGLFTSPQSPLGPRTYAPPTYGAPYAVAPEAYASVPPAATAAPYTLDAGDRMRITVFGQEGITNTYIVDPGGTVSLPLIGSIVARGMTTRQLSQAIAQKLKHGGFVRDPNVSIELVQARPFFILGEVTTPGQYPYVANMTVETAVAIAGGFAPRASKYAVQLTRNLPGQQMRAEVPLNFPVRPGDTIVVKERWF
ncbi:MAG TPA: polysaccharide biosynthesis/export family protein [Pseudolabrys sp.]|nr:polysaccharide biosynthesis/export family protein [Pseudolabrys sp.]